MSMPSPALSRYEVVIDAWRPAALNELLRAGPFGAARLKKLDADYIALYTRLARVPIARGRRRVSLRITLPPKQRRWDKDAFWKSLLDGCVKAGLLVDDGPKWCEPGTVTYGRDAALCTTIVIEEV